MQEKPYDILFYILYENPHTMLLYMRSAIVFRVSCNFPSSHQFSLYLFVVSKPFYLMEL